jgi:hypothetical protein
MDESIRRIDAKDVKPGPIRHEGLSPKMEEVARFTYQAVGHLISPTFEQWELGFLRDSRPERELFLWLVITEAFNRAVADHPDLDEMLIVSDLAAISTGAESTHGLADYYHSVLRKLEDKN